MTTMSRAACTAAGVFWHGEVVYNLSKYVRSRL